MQRHWLLTHDRFTFLALRHNSFRGWGSNLNLTNGVYDCRQVSKVRDVGREGQAGMFAFVTQVDARDYPPNIPGCFATCEYLNTPSRAVDTVIYASTSRVIVCLQ